MKTIYILLVLSSSLFGRIGETREQCHSRYGDDGPLPQLEDNTLVYNKLEFRLILTFIKGKCTGIVYRKKNDESFSDVELEKLRAVNFKGEWSIGGETNVKIKVWKSSDDLIKAMYLTETKVFVVITMEELARLDADKKASELKALDGL